MNRVLLVDDSPHAQRIGERILTDEGYEVVTVSNADSAFVRLEDADPDVVIADTVMPGRTGFEICQYIKMNPRFRHVRVILTAGVLEPLDEAQVAQVQADGQLKKPFEASLLVAAVKPLAESARLDRERFRTGAAPAPVLAAPSPVAPFVAVVEPEQVRAAVTIALDASMESMVDEITRRVMAALQAKPEAKADMKVEAKPAPAPPQPEVKAEPEPVPAASTPLLPHPAPLVSEPVRRVNPLRMRPTTSILGLESPPPDSEFPPPDSQS